MAKGEDFYWRGIHKLPERWEKCITSDEAYLNKALSIVLPNLTYFYFNFLIYILYFYTWYNPFLGKYLQPDVQNGYRFPKISCV